MTFEAMARQSQKAFEPLVAMIFFVPEAPVRYKTLGLNGRQGYFCARASAMGPVPGQVVASTFYNFNPAYVIPLVEKGWQSTTPHATGEERNKAVGEALRRLLAPADEGEAELPGPERAVELFQEATAKLPIGGRSLFAAYAAQPWPQDPLVALWHGANLLREFRGDGHIVALMSQGISPVESILMQAAYSPRLPLSFLVQSRAWSEEEVAGGQADLASRGLLQDGKLTDQGQAVREQIEDLTDRMDTLPFATLGEAKTQELITLVGAFSRRVFDHGGLSRDILTSATGPKPS